MTDFSPGNDCVASGSSGWCVRVEDCRSACQQSGASTSAQLRQMQAALAASQADLSSKYATIRELLGILDEFQVASGADRNAALVTGIEAVRRLRTELARVEQARGEMSRTNSRLHGEVLTVQSERDYLRVLLDEQQAELSADLTLALAELDAARQSARDARSWQVARQDVGVGCASCSQPIVRGQAFQPLADAKGWFSHCACPDKES